MTTSHSTILRAAWIAPMNRPAFRDGMVSIQNGRIVEVGPAAEMLPRHPASAIEDLGDVLLLPGLVNAHVHLELSDLVPSEPPASFVDWLLGVIGRGPPPGEAGEARAAAAARAGIAQCLRFGVT